MNYKVTITPNQSNYITVYNEKDEIEISLVSHGMLERSALLIDIDNEILICGITYSKGNVGTDLMERLLNEYIDGDVRVLSCDMLSLHTRNNYHTLRLGDIDIYGISTLSFPGAIIIDTLTNGTYYGNEYNNSFTGQLFNSTCILTLLKHIVAGPSYEKVNASKQTQSSLSIGSD